MNKDKVDNQIPLLQFLNKHKWRIILPLLFSLFYLALPRYLTHSIAVQQNVFFKSTVLSKSEMNKEFLDIKEQVLSNESLKELILKYDLYKAERENNTSQNSLAENLRHAIEIRLDDEATSQSALIWIHLRKENAQNIVPLSNEVIIQFEKNPNIHVDKYASEPYDANLYRNYVFFGGLLQGLVMLVIPLILLWEFPNIFYSSKTKEMVFDPLHSDWRDELFEAKLKNQHWKTVQINIHYSYAFIATMIQKSFIRHLFESINKLAK